MSTKRKSLVIALGIGLIFLCLLFLLYPTEWLTEAGSDGGLAWFWNRFQHWYGPHFFLGVGMALLVRARVEKHIYLLLFFIFLVLVCFAHLNAHYLWFRFWAWLWTTLGGLLNLLLGFFLVLSSRYYSLKVQVHQSESRWL